MKTLVDTVAESIWETYRQSDIVTHATSLVSWQAMCDFVSKCPDCHSAALVKLARQEAEAAIAAVQTYFE